MKFFVTILALCLVGVFAELTEEQKAKVKEYREACMTETEADKTVIDNALKGDIAEDDDKLKCYNACMLKKMGIMNADGTFNEQVFRTKISDNIAIEKVDHVVEKCKDSTGDTDCERAFQLFKCYMHEKDFSVMD